MLSRTSGCQADTGTRLQGQRSSFRQSRTLSHYPTLEEAIREEFRTLWNYHSSQKGFFYPSTSESSLHCTSCLPCLSTRTRDTKHHSKLGSVTTAAYWSWRRYWIRNLRDFGFKTQAKEMSTFIPYPVGRIQRNRPRNGLVTCHGIKTCRWIGPGLPRFLPEQPRTIKLTLGNERQDFFTLTLFFSVLRLRPFPLSLMFFFIFFAKSFKFQTYRAFLLKIWS